MATEMVNFIDEMNILAIQSWDSSKIRNLDHSTIS